jgi:NADP-dependent 3-hydroxy acid dehydrogenase YdfG
MAQGVKDKVVVITGASSGLDEATARLLVAEGAILVLGARHYGDEACCPSAFRRPASGGEPYNIRTTVISPGAVATELPNSVTDTEAAARVGKFYAEAAIPADSFARAGVFAIGQPEVVDVNEIIFRPTHQEY